MHREDKSAVRDSQFIWPIRACPAKPGVSPKYQPLFPTAFAETATQLTLLPLASPASAFVYEYDPATGLSTRTSESFGPVLTERGETICCRWFYFGATWQRFHFDKLDGQSLSNLPALIGAVSGSGPAGDHYVESQFISTKNSVDIELNQVTFFATYGLTNHLDVSLAVPVMQVDFNVTSQATIERIAGTEPIATPGPGGTRVIFLLQQRWTRTLWADIRQLF